MHIARLRQSSELIICTSSGHKLISSHTRNTTLSHCDCTRTVGLQTQEHVSKGLKMSGTILSGIHRRIFAMRWAMQHDLRRKRAMQTREIPFTEEVCDATMLCTFGVQFNAGGYVTMVFAWFGTTCTNLQATLEPLYNFAVGKVKIVRQIACSIAKVEPSSTSAIAQLRQLRGLRDGYNLGISRFGGRRIACRIAKMLYSSGIWLRSNSTF